MLRMPDQRAAAPHNAMMVICLCAAWCDTCTEFCVAFDRIASQRPAMRFVWLDIEDDSDICGDIEVENFPTLAVYRGDRLLHFGVSLPQEGAVARLVDAMAAGSGTNAAAPDPVLELPRRLRQRG